MANIINELNNIMSARYGEEVRGSIHDGIEKINDELESSESETTNVLNSFSGRVGDVEDRQDTLEDELQEIIHSGDNPIAELINARGTYTTLGNRLDANDTIVDAIDSEIETARDGQANLNTRLTNIESTATTNLKNVFKLGTRNGTQNVQNNSGTINISSSTDIDKLVYTGFYTYTGNYTMYTNSYVNYIEVIARSSTQCIQNWYQHTTNRRWTRYYNSGVWSEWLELGVETKDLLWSGTSSAYTHNLTLTTNLNNYNKLYIITTDNVVVEWDYVGNTWYSHNATIAYKWIDCNFKSYTSSTKLLSISSAIWTSSSANSGLGIKAIYGANV